MQTSTALPRHKLTIEDYHRMGESGILNEDDRVELIEGELVDMPPIGSKHADCVSRLTRLLIRQTEAVVRVQDPIQLPGYSEPEPDIAIVCNRSYAQDHPGTKDVLLLIEVADSSLDYDRMIKVPLYAHHGIPEVWLIDVQNERMEIHRQPSLEGYRLTLRPAKDESVSPAMLPEVGVRVTEVFGEEK